MDYAKVRADNFNTLYYETAKMLTSDKSRTVDLSGKVRTREIIGYTGVLNNPYDRIVTLKDRDVSMRYIAGEFCFYLSGSRELDFINKYSTFWNRVSDDGYTVNSAYGYTVFKKDGKSQFEYAYNCLLEDKHSRKAIMYLSGDYNQYKSKDNICTSTIQFLIRDDKLYTVVTMRSNDIWFGFTYDVAFFTLLQEIMLLKLQKTYDIKMGEYVHHAGSMHVYKKDYKKLRQLVDNGLKSRVDIKPFPKLLPRDVDEWFKDLLDYEEKLRTTGRKSRGLSTPFQQYCIGEL